MSALSFDATQVSPQVPREAWPKGKYKVAITQSEIKEVGQKGAGNRGIFFGAKAMEMLGAPEGFQLPASQILWNINFQHTNETTQRIGQAELSSICHACGVLKITDTGMLHGHPFVIDVDHRFVQDKNEDGSLKVDAQGQAVGKTYNDIKGYYKADGAAITVSKGTAPQAQAAPPPAWAANAAPAQPPVAAAPAPPPAAPAPAPAPTALYYVNRNGATDPTPVPLAQVLAMNPAEIAVNEYGTQAWVKGDDFFAAHVKPAAPANNPPWMKPQQ